MKRTFLMLLRVTLLLLFLIPATIGLIRFGIWLYARPQIYRVDNAPAAPVAIVFGAGLLRDGSPTPVLRDRVATAVDLYHAGKVEKLLMSGDNRFIEYNEPGAMAQYAMSLGVPEEDIVLDYAGRRTYDTCYRADYIFGVKDALLVTQNFHLPRAIYTCNRLGIHASGVTADRRQYSRGPYAYWNLRETLATTNALWEVHFARPLPVLGQYEPIFPPEVQ